jgi:hypothetical protein
MLKQMQWARVVPRDEGRQGSPKIVDRVGIARP